VGAKKNPAQGRAGLKIRLAKIIYRKKIVNPTLTPKIFCPFCRHPNFLGFIVI